MLYHITGDDINRIKRAIVKKRRPSVLCCNEPSPLGSLHMGIAQCSRMYEFVTFYWCPNVTSFELSAYNGDEWFDADASALHSNVEHVLRTIEWLVVQSLLTRRVHDISQLMTDVPNNSDVLMVNSSSASNKLIEQIRRKCNDIIPFSIDSYDDDDFEHVPTGMYKYSNNVLRLTSAL